jgi:transposase
MYHSVVTLYKRGMSQRQIAQTLKLSKSTVNKYINTESAEIEEKLLYCKKSSQFDIAYDFILGKLEQFPRIRSSKLYRLVKEKYPEITSKARAFRSYVKKIRSQIPSKPPRYYQPVIDDKPGHQVQVDPGETKVRREDGSEFKVYFVAFVMSYSRKKFVHFQSSHYNTKDFITAHLEAFQYFGSIAEEYVYDQTKMVVIKENYREVWLNEQFHRFALQNGFEPRVCEGYDPESKGKVERVVKEVQEDFLYGEYYNNVEDVRSRSFDWLKYVNKKKHSTTGIEPDVLYADEIKFMKPWYEQTSDKRKADKVGFISYKGNKYSVPYQYQRAELLVKEHGDELIIMNIAGKIIATHKMPEEKNQMIKNRNHYRDFNKVLNELKEEARKILSTYKNGNLLVEKLVRDNPKIARDQIRGLLKIYNANSELDWDRVIDNSLQLVEVRASRIEVIVEKLKKFYLLQEIEFSSSNTSSAKPVKSSIQRSLDRYMEVIND